MASKKAKSTRMSKKMKAMLELRNRFWPEIGEAQLWSRQRDDGYTSIPRTMPLILRIVDALCQKGAPVSSSYLSLWCRNWDQSIIEITNENEMAFESGFSGQRAVYTWSRRIRQLESLGFIKIKPGAKSEFQYVLLLHPHQVIVRLFQEEQVQEQLRTSFFARCLETGASVPEP